MGSQADYYNQVYQTAIAMGIPETQAQLAAAMSSLETGFGESDPGNNAFGIKGEGQTLSTKESEDGSLVSTSDSFKTYDDLDDSVADWWDLLQTNWTVSATTDDFETAAEALTDGKYGAYATDGVEDNDPLTYADKLENIASAYAPETTTIQVDPLVPEEEGSGGWDIGGLLGSATDAILGGASQVPNVLSAGLDTVGAVASDPKAAAQSAEDAIKGVVMSMLFHNSGIGSPGEGGAYVSSDAAPDSPAATMFDANTLLPASMNTSNWLTGY